MISVHSGFALLAPNLSLERNSTSFDTVAGYHTPSLISCSNCRACVCRWIKLVFVRARTQNEKEDEKRKGDLRKSINRIKTIQATMSAADPSGNAPATATTAWSG